jgi:hypothetical protein
MTSDPNLRWDGQQWVRWDGAQWRPEVPATATGAGLAEYSQQRPANAPPTYPAPPAYPPAAYAPSGPAYVTDQRSKNVQATIAWVLAVLTVGYLLPWAIAATRGKSNAGMIGVLNVLLGWTLVGWIIALVMACGTHQLTGAHGAVTVVTQVGMQAPFPPPRLAQPSSSAYTTHAAPVPATSLGAAPSPPAEPQAAERSAEWPVAPGG